MGGHRRAPLIEGDIAEKALIPAEQAAGNQGGGQVHGPTIERIAEAWNRIGIGPSVLPQKFVCEFLG